MLLSLSLLWVFEWLLHAGGCVSHLPPYGPSMLALSVVHTALFGNHSIFTRASFYNPVEGGRVVPGSASSCRKVLWAGLVLLVGSGRSMSLPVATCTLAPIQHVIVGKSTNMHIHGCCQLSVVSFCVVALPWHGLGGVGCSWGSDCCAAAVSAFCPVLQPRASGIASSAYLSYHC